MIWLLDKLFGWYAINSCRSPRLLEDIFPVATAVPGCTIGILCSYLFLWLSGLRRGFPAQIAS